MEKILGIFKRINPCNANENSFIWKFLSTVFPHECWCCSAVRGMVYGVVLTSIFLFMVGIL